MSYSDHYHAKNVPLIVLHVYTIFLALRYYILLLSKKLLTSQSYQKTEICKYFSRCYYIFQMYAVNPRFYKHNETTKLVFYKLMVLIPYYNYIPMLINHDIYSVNPYSIKVIHIIVYYIISYLSKLNMYFWNIPIGIILQ